MKPKIDLLTQPTPHVDLSASVLCHWQGARSQCLHCPSQGLGVFPGIILL